jgi:hypothetical protein
MGQTNVAPPPADPLVHLEVEARIRALEHDRELLAPERVAEQLTLAAELLDREAA